MDWEQANLPPATMHILRLLVLVSALNLSQEHNDSTVHDKEGEKKCKIKNLNATFATVAPAHRSHIWVFWDRHWSATYIPLPQQDQLAGIKRCKTEEKRGWLDLTWPEQHQQWDWFRISPYTRPSCSFPFLPNLLSPTILQYNADADAAVVTLV